MAEIAGKRRSSSEYLEWLVGGRELVMADIRVVVMYYMMIVTSPISAICCGGGAVKYCAGSSSRGSFLLLH